MTRAELLERADALAQSATQRVSGRGYADNTPGNVAALREATVEETEAMRLTLIALLTPLAEVAEAFKELLEETA